MSFDGSLELTAASRGLWLPNSQHFLLGFSCLYSRVPRCRQASLRIRNWHTSCCRGWRAYG